MVEEASRHPSPSVSVVVPALNEHESLPGFLACIARQTVRPIEVIVADGGSADDTVVIARALGALVVDGGRPAVGRSAGARAAKGDLLLFLDADSRPSERFIEDALSEFADRGISVAGAPVEPIERRPDYVAACRAARLYLMLIQRAAPHAAGSCILVRRDVHDSIGGFDETLALAEDHDYVRRAARAGVFRILTGVSIPVSMRRVVREGRLRLGLKYAYCEVHTLAGRPIRHAPFHYEFAEGGGQRRTLASARRRFVRTLEQPSTEVQADAIGVALASAIGGGAGAVALAAAGAGPDTYLPIAGIAFATAGLSAWEATRKLRFERRYGDFFMASLAVASFDLFDDDGRMLAQRGVDRVWELHAIGALARMADLNRQGGPGRLTIVLEALEGMRAMLDDETARTEDAAVVTGRSDLIVWLLKMGFAEIADPPAYDLANRIDKRLLGRYLARTVRGGTFSEHGASRMAVMSATDFFGPRFREALEAQVARVRAGLERASSRAERRDGGGPPAVPVS